ncbi:MAG TPA: CoA transferase [Caulobacteraceae bacterium]|nr:CoA transferase [Caulobacteraceae bacterium]
MPFTRRGILHTAGALAVAASAPGAVQAATDDFAIDQVFADFMRNVGGSAQDAGGTITFTGRDPIVGSHFRIGASMAVPAMAAAVGAAAIMRERTGQTQDASIDLRQAVYGVAPWMRLLTDELMADGILTQDPLPSGLAWQPTLNGRALQGPLLLGNPLSFGLFETKDDRLVTPTGIYPQHFVGFLGLIGADPTRRSIVERIRTFNSADLEQRVGEAGMIMGIHRTPEEWLAHPQGKYLATVPVIEIVKIGDSAPTPWTPNPTAPLSGVKVLSCTHVIASTTSSRTLAGYGAEVLHVARDQALEHDALVVDVNVGMRSTLLNLKNPEQNRVLQGLLPQADVFVEGFRGRKMQELGFGPEEVARRKPGIVYLSARAYGWDGPWRDFAGFDMEGLTVTGFTMVEGGGQRPRFPPTFVMNDYIAGYMGAAGVLAALRRRAKEGGSYHVRVSLARAAMWFMSLGHFPNTDFDLSGPDNRIGPPETIRAQTPWGDLERLAPLVKLSRTPTRWRDPLVVVRGGDKPVWAA